MDSIERMRKLNELTKELKRHGFAESSFDAMSQAQQIYGDDELTENVKHGLIQNSAHEKVMRQGEHMENTDTDRKITKLSESVETLTAKMNEMIKAINDMDARITLIKNRPVERVVEKVFEHAAQQSESSSHIQETNVTHAQAESTAPVHDEPKKDEYSMNQRTGNYSPQDVAIDKMFYYGKK